MANDLYFIPIIAEALREPDPSQALRQAFKTIQKLGRRAEYGRGYAQFQAFMAAVRQAANARRLDQLTEDVVRELILELAAGRFDADPAQRATVESLVRSRPEWEQLLEEVLAELNPAQAETLALLLSHDGQPVPEMVTDEKSVHTFSGLAPGHYVLAMDSGRVLWEADLNAKDLIWTEAFPGRPLELAADTGDLGGPTSRESRLLGGELEMRILPGIESGHLEVRVEQA